MLRCIFALLLAVSAAQAAVDFTVLESVPIQEGGRKKPFLVFAEESLLGLSGHTSFTQDGQALSAMQTVTTLWLEPAGWETKPLILVSSKPLKEATGLDPDRKLFSFNELAANTKLLALINQAQAPRPENERLKGIPKEASDVGLRLTEFQALADGSVFRFIASPDGAGAPWIAVPGTSPIVANLRDAFEKSDDARFQMEASSLKRTWAATQPQFQPVPWKMHLELTYQKAHPFHWAWICYALAGLVLFFTSRENRRGYAAAWAFALLGFLWQVSGIICRVLIAGRPPVTNMYESVVWVAFVTIFFALLFEAIYRNRYFLMGAIPVAVVSLVLADTQVVSLGRAINPLVPVLRDNFWLTIHVLTIASSYAAFALSMGIGHIILGTAIAGRKPATAIYNSLYRTLQVGVLLLATGTILGAVWANYSWGRFWDWDPKETWALITLLGYLIVLHGRIAGRWGGFGLGVGSVLAFQGVLMAWYGVNFILGVGLHSYGFGTGGFGWAAGFVIAELCFVAFAVSRYKNLAAPAAKAVSSGEPELAS